MKLAGCRRYTMKLSPRWIRDFVDPTVDDRRLAEDLTGVGIAVEGISGAGADAVFEMEIGTNRPDAMNHYGVAREVAAIYDLPLKQLSVRHPSAVSKTLCYILPDHRRRAGALSSFLCASDTRNQDQRFADKNCKPVGVA